MTDPAAAAVEARQSMSAGAPDRALAIWEILLREQPHSVEALIGAADCLMALKKPAKAIEYYRTASVGNPLQASLLFGLGTAEAAAGDLTDARKHLEESVTLDDANPHAHNNLASVLLRQSGRRGALRHYNRALTLKPDLESARRGAAAAAAEPHQPIETYMSRGFAAINKAEFAAAKHDFQKAVISSPLKSEAWAGLGLAQLGLWERQEALESLEEAVRHDPNNIEALYHRVIALRALGRAEEAVAACQDVLSVDPGEVRAWAARGAIELERGQITRAIPDLEKALAGRRHQSREAVLAALCFAYRIFGQWGEKYQTARAELIEILSDDEVELGPLVVAPFQLLPLGMPAEVQRVAARRASAKGDSGAANLPAGRRRSSGGKIRLGYISPDFRNHSIAASIRNVIGSHDRNKFEVFGFALNQAQDETTNFFISAFDQLHTLASLNHTAAAKVIAEQGIDILVDLAGHTKGGRLEILAQRPAPVQVHAIGYGGPLCAPYLPWRLTDAISTPTGVRQFFDEELIDLPQNALPASRPAIEPEPLTRRELGLPRDAPVFANFGGTYKIDPESLDAWAEILRRVPAGLLVLLDLGQTVRGNLWREMKARGISPDRLIFSAFLDAARHLGRYKVVDLCLDTLVHNGGVTTTDALWIETPVLTSYRGDLPDRTGASLLAAAGLPQLVATDSADYVSRACQLATTPGALAALRHQVLQNQNTAPLFDTALFTRNLEAALLDLWTRAVDNQASLQGDAETDA